MTRLYLGVDAGNSKTVAMLVDAEGTVHGRGRAPVGDIYAVPAEQAVRHVVSAVAAALSFAGAVAGEVEHAAFRLAGVDWDEDEAYWQDAIATQLPGLRSWSVKNDGYALLRCGDLSGRGVAVTAGTGAAVGARGPTGAEWSASWWIQDRAGGRDLGRAAFEAVVRADVGTGPVTSLTGRLLALYEEPDAAGLLHAFTRRVDRRPESDLWRGARPVLQAAGDGDPVATEIVRTQAAVFVAHARVGAEKVGYGPGDAVVVVLGGSVLASEHGAFREAVTEQLREALPAAVVRGSVGSPLAGAVLDALAEGGVAVAVPLRERVIQARHPEDFLLTE